MSIVEREENLSGKERGKNSKNEGSLRNFREEGREDRRARRLCNVC